MIILSNVTGLSRLSFRPMGQLTRDIFTLLTRKSRLRKSGNRSILIEGSLFVVIDLLRGAKFNTLYFLWRVGERSFGGGCVCDQEKCGLANCKLQNIYEPD